MCGSPVSDFPIYLFIFVVFLNRYVFGFYLTRVKGGKIDETITGCESRDVLMAEP